MTSQNTESCYLAEAFASKVAPLGNEQKNISNFKVVRGLGRGAFGQVYMVKDQCNSTCAFTLESFYAMKTIPKQRITTEQEKIHTLS